MTVRKVGKITFQGVPEGQENDFLSSLMTPGTGIYQDLCLTLGLMFPEQTQARG